MLLPESFKGTLPPETLVAFDEACGAIVGAVAFHRLKRETVQTQVTVVPTHRRSGIGSRLLDAVCARALARGDEQIHATVDRIAHLEAESFLESNGFRCKRRLLRVEGDLAPLRTAIETLLHRLASSGKIPATARVVEPRNLAAEITRPWYEQVVAPEFGVTARLTEHVLTSADCGMLLVDGHPAGLAAGTRNDGSDVGWLHAVVVAPEYRGGWGWAYSILLDAAIRAAWEAGARRLRFEAEEKNWRVLQTLGRVQGVVVGCESEYSRKVL